MAATCSTEEFVNRKMDQFQTVNSDPTMIATRTFEDILSQLKSSNLNFHLQQSPFAAQISLKKSLVRDKAGVPLPPPKTPTFLLQQTESDMATITRRNLYLEKKVESLNNDLENSALDCENAYAAKSKLEKHLSEISCVKEVKSEINEDLQRQFVDASRKL
jgi:hypothetical protein